ncbi:DUF1573 domain-containing protein [bacterium]|nr:DUF1573 domain-containing protein [bacterium]
MTTLIVKGFVNVLPGPLICVTPKKWDYGIIEPGAAPQRTFIVKNTGVKDLVIFDINTSSGCHAQLLSAMTIHPSEEAVLNVTLDKLNMTGLIEDFVKISCNDTSMPNFFIRINGYVKGLKPQSLKLLSDRIDLGVIDFSDDPQSANFKLTLFNIGDKPLTIKKIDVPKKFLKKFTTPFAVNPRQNKSINFSIKNNNEYGTFKNIIIIHSNDYSVNRKKIILFGYAAR